MAKTKGGLAGLAALRASLPEGPATAHWLVATGPGGAPAGWLAVTSARQTLGRGLALADVDLPLATFASLAIVRTDGGAELEIVGFGLQGRGPNGEPIEEPSAKGSVRLDGKALVVVGSRHPFAAGSTLTMSGPDGTYRLSLETKQPAPATAKAAKKRDASRDLIVTSGRREHAGDLDVGWLEVSGGELVCTGVITCRGAALDGGVVRCTELVGNYIQVDGHAGARLETQRVRARVLDLVENALADLVERGAATADYIQHFGGDLNPSWDYARGANPLRDDLYAPTKHAWVEIDVRRLRDALAAGEAIFTAGPLLVP